MNILIMDKKRYDCLVYNIHHLIKWLDHVIVIGENTFEVIKDRLEQRHGIFSIEELDEYLKARGINKND